VKARRLEVPEVFGYGLQVNTAHVFVHVPRHVRLKRPTRSRTEPWGVVIHLLVLRFARYDCDCRDGRFKPNARKQTPIAIAGFDNALVAAFQEIL
jgi:hypothetical protein